MIDGIPAGILDGISIVTVVVLFGLGLATGRIFTRRQYDEVLHDRDEWRTESRLKDAQIAEKDNQLRHMGEVGRTVQAIMQSIQRGPRSDGP